MNLIYQRKDCCTYNFSPVTNTDINLLINNCNLIAESIIHITMSNTYWMDHQDIASKCQMKLLGPFCRYLARNFFKATLTMSLDADEKLTRFDFLRYYLAEIGDDLCLVIYQPTDSSNAVSSLHFDNTGVFRLNKMRHALDSGLLFSKAGE